MLYFIVRLIANAIAVALTVAFTPGIDLRPDATGPLNILIGFILLGLLFGLINSFVRPVVLFITGRFVIGTMGLFTLLTNGLLFYFLGSLIPEFLMMKDPVLLRSIFAGALMAVVVIIVEAIFGLDSPVIDGSGVHKAVEHRSTLSWRNTRASVGDRQAYPAGAHLRSDGDLGIVRAVFVGIGKQIDQHLDRSSWIGPCHRDSGRQIHHQTLAVLVQHRLHGANRLGDDFAKVGGSRGDMEMAGLDTGALK